VKHIRAILLSAAAVVSAHAGVVNGGFETGDFTGWTVGATGAVDTTAPHTGLYAALFNGPSDSITQTIATNPGDTYSISFWLADQGPGIPPNSSFEVDWDHGTVFTLTSTADMAYTERVIHNLTASGPTTDITFMFGQVPVDTGLCSGFQPGVWAFDDVAVYQGNGDPPDAAPEPASIGLAVLAAGGLIALNFRRKRA